MCSNLVNKEIVTREIRYKVLSYFLKSAFSYLHSVDIFHIINNLVTFKTKQHPHTIYLLQKENI